MSSKQSNSESAVRENEILRERVAFLEAQLAAVLEASEGLAWIKDAESRFVLANGAVAELTGLAKDSIPGLFDSDIWEGANVEAVRRDDAEVMQSKAPKFVKEALDERREGRRVWLSTRKVPVLLNGEVVGTAGTARDITDEHWARVDLEAARRELVETHRRRLDELSTPVLRLWEGVLVVPLIGDVDRERATRLMTALLSAIQREGAREVMLDLTGVTVVDSDVAERLLRAVRATRLVGARCSLIGIRPEIAQATVMQDIDIGDVQVFSTLEQALVALMRRSAATPFKANGL